jgi:hypothetical protein
MEMIPKYIGQPFEKGCMTIPRSDTDKQGLNQRNTGEWSGKTSKQTRIRRDIL